MPRQAGTRDACRTLSVMSLNVKLAFLILGSTLFASLSVCVYTVSKYERAFAATVSGEPEKHVIERFGTPGTREIPEHPLLRYATKPCESPCTERLWWEHPVLRGIEAWSVELNSEGNVVHMAHWVSP